eukprot:scaffold32028_cov91-Isochrysis_galbana.AAC.2
MVAGRLHAGEGVGGAAVPRDEVLERLFVRVALRPEEHHVLGEVRQAGDALRVVKVAGLHLERRRRLVGARIRNEQGAQARTELDIPVLTVIQRRSSDVVHHHCHVVRSSHRRHHPHGRRCQAATSQRATASKWVSRARCRRESPHRKRKGRGRDGAEHRRAPRDAGGTANLHSSLFTLHGHTNAP